MIRASIVSLLLVAAVACGEKPSTSDKRREAEPPPPAAQGGQPASASNDMPVPPHASASEASAAAAAQAPPVGNAVTGKVLETMDSAGYTYMNLDTGSGQVWAAVNQAKVKKGQTVTVANAMVMQNFESKTLKRKFDQILFGTLAGGAETGAAPKGGAAPAGATAGKGEMPPGHPQPDDGSMQKMVAQQHAVAGSGADAADVGKISVPKATGADAHTVAEVYAQKASLKDKNVEVRGKVVKYLPQIMGKNWLHVRDGSGSADKKNNDLTVTTKDTAAVGDVVVVRGVVHLDRDLGAGYQYPVLIEDAKVTK